ncbi:hypothetical protein HK105_204959 [Polyrhizophydium stewartii]|uniref:Uncharacterized protein n=1 Tax=Polyrhizophydium stewartii TaxID=2732419 RepID=A0ABR4N7P5_9FUNG
MRVDATAFDASVGTASACGIAGVCATALTCLLVLAVDCAAQFAQTPMAPPPGQERSDVAGPPDGWPGSATLPAVETLLATAGSLGLVIVEIQVLWADAAGAGAAAGTVRGSGAMQRAAAAAAAIAAHIATATPTYCLGIAGMRSEMLQQWHAWTFGAWMAGTAAVELAGTLRIAIAYAQALASLGSASIDGTAPPPGARARFRSRLRDVAMLLAADGAGILLLAAAAAMRDVSGPATAAAVVRAALSLACVHAASRCCHALHARRAAAACASASSAAKVPTASTARLSSVSMASAAGLWRLDCVEENNERLVDVPLSPAPPPPPPKQQPQPQQHEAQRSQSPAPQKPDPHPDADAKGSQDAKPASTRSRLFKWGRSSTGRKE